MTVLSLLALILMSEGEPGEDLRAANEQLRLKYKKALQELMHILKVNKSLKEYLDQSAQARELAHRHQLDALRHQLDQTLQQLHAANHHLRTANDRLRTADH